MDERRLRAVVLIAVALAAAAIQWPLWGWEVDGAALDLGFARHLALGDGIVAQAGRERVEGFSDPAWIALLAVPQWLGLDGVLAGRLLGLLLGCATVPVVWLAARPLAKDPPYGAVAAAAAVGLFGPQAVWAQSGLENPLFTLLVALGLARAGRANSRDLLTPLVFVGVALTRPEGLVYAAAAGIATAAAASGPHSARARLLRWALVLGPPLLLVEVARVWYFAQPFPATFYARLGIAETASVATAWDQLGAFARETGTVALVPFALFGAGGTEGWRGATSAVASGLFLLTAAAGLTELAALEALVVLPIVTDWRRPPLGMAVALLLVGVAFHLGAGGDGMSGYRYLSLLAAPGAVLVGIGTGELADRVDELRHGPLVALGAALVPQVLFVANYARAPEPSFRSGAERATSALALSRRLQIERRPRMVDHDLGGLLWAGGEELWVRDTRGLVDLPFALHGIAPEVVEDELLRDPPFDIAHLAATTEAALGGLPRFRERYVAASPDQYVRRDLVLSPGWDGPPVRIHFAGGAECVGLHVPSPEVTPGGGLYLEIGLTRGEGQPYRALLFLDDGERVRATWEVPPAHDWVAPADWRPEEVFHGRFALPLPADLRRGDYGLGLVLLGPDGAVLPVRDAGAPAVVPKRPLYARGEVRIPGAVRVVPEDDVTRAAQVDRSDALRLADGARCEEAEQAWFIAVRRRPRSTEWRAQNLPTVSGALARCWAARAGSATLEGDALLERVHEIERSRDWDPREPTAWEVGARVAEEAHARATAADLARVRFLWAEAAVRADPRRAWDRRLAEGSRAMWLGAAEPPPTPN